MKNIFRTKKRGSTLILALVLTMVLFIMGIAFVSSSSTDRDNSENISQSQYLNDGVDYTVAQIQKVLKDDLFDGGKLLSGNKDYDYTDSNNQWLASSTPEYGQDSFGPYYYFPQVTDLWGDFYYGKEKYKVMEIAGTESAAYRFDYHYDPDPAFRDTTMINSIFSATNKYPAAWDFSNPLSWRYVTDGTPGLVCRTITADEKIYDSWLNLSNITAASYAGYIPTVNTAQWLWGNTATNLGDVVENWLFTFNPKIYPVGSIFDSLLTYRDYTDQLGLQRSSVSLDAFNNRGNRIPLRVLPWKYRDSGTGAYFNTNLPEDSASGSRADADGDGVADSRWTRKYRLNVNGEYLYVAVRIIDNCAMINLNTAFRKPGHVVSGGYYKPYDNSRPDDVGSIFDNWDGSSVSHVDAFGLVSDTDISAGKIFNVYSEMAIDLPNAFNYPANDDRYDELFKINKAACAYNPRGFGVPSGYNVFDITGAVFFQTFDITDELALRNRFMVQPNDSVTNIRLDNLWQATIKPGNGKAEPYALSDSAGVSGVDDYYEANWAWFGRCGAYLIGDPSGDVLPVFNRRHALTTYNKDRLIMPAFDISGESGPQAYANKNSTANINTYGLDDGARAGDRRYQINIREAGADKDSDGSIQDNQIDMDNNGDPDSTFDVATANGLMAGFYKALRSYDSNPGNINGVIRARYGDGNGNPLSYNSEMLATHFIANYEDYFDLDTNETVKKVTPRYNAGGNNWDHEELYIGFESLGRIEDEVLNISKVAYLHVTGNDCENDGVGNYRLEMDVDIDGVPSSVSPVPNGKYLAVELFNPSINPKTSMNEYVLLILDGSNKVKFSLPFDATSARYEGSMPSMTGAGDADNTMVVLLYDVSEMTNSGDRPEKSDWVYDSTGSTTGPTKYGAAGYDRITNTFGAGSLSSRFIYVDVSGTNLLSSGISNNYSLALVRANTGGGIAGNLSSGDYYPCDTVLLDSCKKAFDLYVKCVKEKSITDPFNVVTPKLFDNNVGDNILRVCYRNDVFGNSFNGSNVFDGSCLLLPANRDNRFNPWCFGFRDISTTGATCCIVPPVLGTQISLPAYDPSSFLGKYVSLVSNPNQLNLVYNTWEVLDNLKNGTPSAWDGYPAAGKARDYYDKLAKDDEIRKTDGYAKVKALMESNFDMRQLYDRFVGGGSDQYWLKSIGQLQDVFVIGARTTEIDENDNGRFPGDWNFPTTGPDAADRVYYQPFINALVDSLVEGVDSNVYANNDLKLEGNVGKVNLGDKLYQNIPNFMTAIDYSRDGIDNNGDGTVDEATETDIYGRININTAPWYVIARLPWVTEEMAQAIVAYRDQRSLSAVPAVNYTNRARGMWDPLGGVTPFSGMVRGGKGFRSVGELMNVTHGLRREFGADSASANAIATSFKDKYVAGYQETAFNENYTYRKPTDTAKNAGLAKGILYDNAFDIQRWGRTANNYAPGHTMNANNWVVRGVEINSNDSTVPWMFNGAVPFYDTDTVANDENELNAVFNKISNLVTTRSDVFTAYILVRVGNDGPQRRYIGIFDRSGVTSTSNEVHLVSLYQVPETD